jgi:hypothetical protein
MMKDMYTFDTSEVITLIIQVIEQEDAIATFNEVKDAYIRILDQLQVKYSVAGRKSSRTLCFYIAFRCR